MMGRAVAQRSSRLNFLPPEAGLFLRRRLAELAGAGLVVLGLALLFALASYTSADPSFDHATARPARNLIGLVGAYGADLLLQSFGLAATLVGVAACGWGWRLLAHLGLERPLFRGLLLAPTLLLAATALSPLPAPDDWPLHQSGLGGFAGRLLFAQAAALAQIVAPGIALRPIGLAAAAPAGALFLYVLGFSWAEWRAVARALLWLVIEVPRQGVASLRATARAAWCISMAPFRAAWRLFARGHGERAFELAQRRLSGVSDGARAKREGGALAVVEPRVGSPGRARRPAPPRQTRLDLDTEAAYELPPLDLLAMPPEAHRHERVDEEALGQNARLLESVLDDFGVKGQIVKVRPGPVVTLYELEPAPGTKSARVISLADDIARSMSAISVRVAVVPGRNVLGIELPNARRETVYLRELLASDGYEGSAANLALVLGKDISGAPVIVDLARMPHLLIAGTTGSGKSVALNTMILSLLYRQPPSQCKFIMIDPKMLELSVYDGIPHLLSPVVTEPKKAVVALKWTVREMENRYRAMSTLGVRNIAGYNARLQEAERKGEVLKRRVQTGFDAETGSPVFEEQTLDLAPLPHIVVVVDEFADLMLIAGKDIEAAVQRLSQMARAAGIHLIMATQRPSVDVITGTIKANFPTRVSFQVTSRIDSRTILNDSGAEQLLGQGDMLYMAGGGRISRVHGPFVRDNEVEAVVRFLKAQGAPAYLEGLTDEEEDEGLLPGTIDGFSGDELYDRAVALVCRERKASTSFVQRHLQIGYNRAARIIERMEAEGVVSAANHVGKREVLARNVDADE